MWRMTAPKPVACAGCEHLIAQGQPLLSDAPEELPSSINRAQQFRHFHLQCQDCKDGGVCYVTYARQQPTHTAEGEAACFYCGEAIWLRQQFAYDDSRVLKGEGDAETEISPVLFILLNKLIQKITPFEGLPKDLQQKFMQAGLGGIRGRRTTLEAAEFYRNSVPWSVRAQGEAAVREFTNGKHASHVESFANSPHLAQDAKNVIWEAGGKNLRRGTKDMSRLDRVSANVRNMAATGKAAARSAGRAALWEAPASAAVNIIRVFRGNLSRKQAAKNTAWDTGRAAASGGAITIAVTSLKFGFVATAPANPAVGAVGAVGTVIFAASTARHLIQALQESPLTPLVLYFHPDCFPRYAAEVSAPPDTN